MTSPEETLVVLKVGEEAPDFEAQAYPSGNLKLSQFKGKKNLILAFYPKDNTPGCTAEMCAFSDDLASFESSDTLVFGVSCDDLKSHERFSQAHSLKIPLIDDSQGKLGRLYGALREGHKTANRKLFVIDINGTIREIIDGMPKNEDLLDILRKL